jgi:hypothetical protein
MSITVKDIQDLGSPNATVRGIAARKIAAAIGSGGSVSWSSITGKPSTFPPSSHTHVAADITDLVGGTPTWEYYATKWDTAPTQAGTVAAGAVWAYVLGGVTRYRLVPSPYDATDDAFYSTFSGGSLSGLITSRSTT